MKKENQSMIIGGVFGLVIGLTSMFFVQYGKDVRAINESYKVESLIEENTNTCEYLIEWMKHDVEMYADSTVFDTYILNLEEMLENNQAFYIQNMTN
tara:strand:- start:17 stop:307 length:291 start_codon:yes stop_codon:yes gene_type:complete